MSIKKYEPPSQVATVTLKSGISNVIKREKMLKRADSIMQDTALQYKLKRNKFDVDETIVPLKPKI